MSCLTLTGFVSCSRTWLECGSRRSADKYSQIYRILLPICNTLSQIPTLAENPALRSYIEDEWGSADGLTREILADFFRHGFDGSGAGNYFDAGGSVLAILAQGCGRLTSIAARFVHRRPPDERVELVLDAGEETLLPGLPPNGCVDYRLLTTRTVEPTS